MSSDLALTTVKYGTPTLISDRIVQISIPLRSSLEFLKQAFKSPLPGYLIGVLPQDVFDY